MVWASTTSMGCLMEAQRVADGADSMAKAPLKALLRQKSFESTEQIPHCPCQRSTLACHRRNNFSDIQSCLLLVRFWPGDHLMGALMWSEKNKLFQDSRATLSVIIPDECCKRWAKFPQFVVILTLSSTVITRVWLKYHSRQQHASFAGTYLLSEIIMSSKSRSESSSLTRLKPPTLRSQNYYFVQTQK